ncbi:MAG: hypothetical protein JWL62_1384, partial [Hyphomicrobiales bacterium]|nr:hypothetical protein [Hyphomicrobiales bacterium]
GDGVGGEAVRGAISNPLSHWERGAAARPGEGLRTLGTRDRNPSSVCSADSFSHWEKQAALFVTLEAHP